MRDVMEVTVVDVRVLTVRGHSDQLVVEIATKRGDLTLRLCGVPGKVVRVLDLRPRDKRKAKVARRPSSTRLEDILTTHLPR